MKHFFHIFFVLCALILLAIPAAAAELEDPMGGLICVAHAGDAALPQVDLLTQLRSASEKGADFVSVRVEQTADGAFGLIGTADDAPTLEEAAAALPERTGLLLDFDWADRTALADRIAASGLSDRVLLRTEQSAKTVAAFLNERGNDVRIISIYRGNIIFNAISHLNILSKAKQPIVQYQSKNYFNVAFESVVPAMFSKNGKARAMAAAYAPDLCGQRSDNLLGWDELIQKGYSVIETNNVSGFVSYIAQCDNTRTALLQLIETADRVDLSQYDNVSGKNFSAAYDAAKAAAGHRNTALSVLQNCLSTLREAMDALTPAGEVSAQKGSLNVTPGKVVVIVVFGALILAGEIFVFRMRKKKETL